MKNNRLVYHLLFSVLLTVYLFSCNKEKDEKDSSTNGLFDLYIYDVNSKTTTNITKTPDAAEFDYLFYHNRAKILFYYYGEYYSMNTDGSQKSKLSDSELIYNVDLSPDDKTIVYRVNKNLYLANADGTNRRQLTSDNVDYYHLKWSGDGQKIACARYNKIYTVTLDGKAENICDGYFYYWSPDSKEVVYKKSGGVFKYNIADKTETMLASNYWNGAVFNPVNSKTAFTAWDGEMYNLMLCNADGTGQKSILRRRMLGAPFWSPDGTQIVFVTSEQYPDENNVGICDINGNNFRIINPVKGFCQRSVWSPDGKYILYSRVPDFTLF
jgi:Tol biopolymer transport system component